jgi:hypothetical protein
MRNAAKMFSFDPNPTTARKAWSSSTCLLYAHPPHFSLPSTFKYFVFINMLSFFFVFIFRALGLEVLLYLQ